MNGLIGRQPAIFIGHGSPMNALEDNVFTRAWASFGAQIVKPRAILAISAHWYVDGTRVTAMDRPPTIHDFSNFPRPLHEFSYPAPGDPVFARQVAEALAPLEVRADRAWGLDHGTWSVLTHVFPNADVPVVQLSMDARRPPDFHCDLGRRLAALRDTNVLLLATGNVVHNLGLMFAAERSGDPWAQRFEDRLRELAEAGDTPALMLATELPDARRAIPTPEHYLPLLYILGSRQADEAVSFPTRGVIAGAISMLSIRVG